MGNFLCTVVIIDSLIRCDTLESGGSMGPKLMIFFSLPPSIGAVSSAPDADRWCNLKWRLDMVIAPGNETFCPEAARHICL
jgi:hypothetical protein